LVDRVVELLVQHRPRWEFGQVLGDADAAGLQAQQLDVLRRLRGA
jgi:hypothetical protein